MRLRQRVRVRLRRLARGWGRERRRCQAAGCARRAAAESGEGRRRRQLERESECGGRLGQRPRWRGSWGRRGGRPRKRAARAGAAPSRAPLSGALCRKRRDRRRAVSSSDSRRALGEVAANVALAATAAVLRHVVVDELVEERAALRVGGGRGRVRAGLRCRRGQCREREGAVAAQQQCRACSCEAAQRCDGQGRGCSDDGRRARIRFRCPRLRATAAQAATTAPWARCHISLVHSCGCCAAQDRAATVVVALARDPVPALARLAARIRRTQAAVRQARPRGGVESPCDARLCDGGEEGVGARVGDRGTARGSGQVRPQDWSCTSAHAITCSAQGTQLTSQSSVSSAKKMTRAGSSASRAT